MDGVLAPSKAGVAVALPARHFVWPRVTPALTEAVMRQTSPGIFGDDYGGVAADFEAAFAAYYGARYALLTNSGANAVFAMYAGMNLLPGDEVICPVYAPPTTVSPLMHTGATPVFCDCLPDGTIDPAEIERRMSPRTRAVVVAHPWGVPCAMDQIRDVCERHRVPLLEDASHAHGARFRGQLVGTFGEAAAWSLDGQQIITAGGGGVMLTANKHLLDRALLHGYDGVQAARQLASSSPLAMFAPTGFGLAFRPHPLGIAIARHLLNDAEGRQRWRQAYASAMLDAFSSYPFLEMPNTCERAVSWQRFTTRYVPERANGVGIAAFVRALHAKGLSAISRPTSVRTLYNLPLFSQPHKALPRLYTRAIAHDGKFPNADRVFLNTIALPVWAYADERPIVDAYIAGVRSVADAVLQSPSSLG